MFHRETLAFETGTLEPVEFAGLTLELTQLAPYPFSATPIKPEDYRATLRLCAACALCVGSCAL